jgi:glycosyltransferase involved in cell wall biosynthesis
MENSPTDHRLPYSQRLISICIPVFNEQDNIPVLLSRLRNVAKEHATRYDFEFLFTDDASTDSSYRLLAQAAGEDHRIRVLRLSRNFGFQRNVLTSFLNARGDAAIELDADLQDPPELIGEFLALWEKGYKVVYGVRTQRNENIFVTTLRRLAYRIIRGISDVPVPVDAGDFRLIDRVIIENLRGLADRNPYLRGAIAAIGYPQIGVPYERPLRAAGYSKFPLLRLMKLGIDGIISQSIRPLHYITVAALLLSALTGGLIIFYFVGSLIGAYSPQGFTTLVLLQLFAITMNAIFLAVLGEYIGRIFNNVRGHPVAIIEKTIEGGAEAPSDSFDPNATMKSDH